MISDHELFEKQDYEGILKKYLPLIRGESLKQYHKNNIGDRAIEFDDIYQINMMISFKYILYIQHKIEKNKISFKNGATFGLFLKKNIKSYYLSRVRKKRNAINKNLRYIPDYYNFLHIDYEKDNSNYIDLFSDNNFYTTNFEFNCYFENFKNSLSDEEKKFIIAFQYYGKCKGVAELLNVSSSYTRKMRNHLKQKYIDYFFKGK